MGYETFLALRYLRSRRRHRLARATTIIALIGIAAGVASLIVALAIADGFRDEMRDKILRGTAHINVMRADGGPFTNYREVAAKITTIPGVVSAAGSTYDCALVIGPKNSAYAILRGVDQPASQAGEISQTIIRGSLDPLFSPVQNQQELPAVILGAELAKRIGVDVGATVEVVAAQSGLTSRANPRRVRVAGLFRSGLFEYDSTWIYLSLGTVAAFTAGAHAASVVSVQVADIYDVKRTAAWITQAVGDEYLVVDWQDANRPLFTALTLERRVGTLIIAIIILIAALNITTTLILLVMERRRDIAILSAMGATANGITKIFIIEGGLLGLFGAVIGMVVGVVVVFAGNRYHLITLPSDVYSISHVPLHLNVFSLIFSGIIAFALSVLATIYPARAASQIHAAALLRNS
jgi:lipoprotein-releasing system permease protein